MTCPACGAENPAGARFCNNCAAPLAAVPAREVRKVVTILFCDVTGSTALGERLDPEQLRAVMTEYFAVARAAIERHGGTIEKFIGDAVMAVFGVPIVREDDALRAVRAAIDLRDAAQIDVRIGLNTGEVVTGTGETLVTGDAVNVAARLEQAAGVGEILIGESTHALVRNAVEVEPVAPIAAKGKSKPVTAHRVRDLTGATPYARRTDAPLVGRQRERALLADAWERALAGLACVQFTILGSAGVGKSRLVAEFLDGLDATVVSGRCLSYGEGITYWPVVETVKQLLGAGPAPNAAIAALLGDGDAVTEDIASAVRRLFESSARQRPLVVYFDDLQWAEPTLLELIEHITDWAREAPLLVLCSARPDLLELRPGWGGGKLNATTVLLEPLTDAETGELIARLLGSAELPDGMHERIAVAAEGNPLFVEQMLAMVQESGEVNVSVPPTIQALLAARLDQLPNGERAALERGAVEGQVFHRRAVQALAPNDLSVPSQLMGLVRKELVRPTAAALPDDDAFRFRHLLIRDAAYDALPKATRADLHERFARWLDQHGTNLVELDEILGYHLEQAARYAEQLGRTSTGLAREAVQHLIPAGKRACMRGDYIASRKLLERALALLPPGDPSRLPALPWLGLSLSVTGDFQRANEVLAEAISEGDSSEEGAIAYFVAAVEATMMDGVPFEERERSVRLRLAALEADGASDLVLAQGYDAQSRLLMWLGRTGDQLVAADRMRAHARRAGQPALEALAAGAISSAMLYGATPWAEFEPFVRSTVDDRERLGRLATRGLASLAYAAAYQGRIDEARRLFAEADAEFPELGPTWLVSNKGFSEYMARELDRAVGILRRGWNALGEVGESGLRSTAGALLATSLADLGELHEAEQILAEAEALGALDDWLTTAIAKSCRALIASARADHGLAVELARDAVALGDRHEWLSVRPLFWIQLGRVLASGAHADQADEAFEESVRLARLKGSTALEDWAASERNAARRYASTD